MYTEIFAAYAGSCLFNLNASLRIQLKVKYVAVTEPENYLSVLLGWVGIGDVVWWGE